MDNKQDRGPADRARINIHEPYELQYWSKELNVTPEELKKAVEQKGVMVSDVRRHLAAK